MRAAIPVIFVLTNAADHVRWMRGKARTGAPVAFFSCSSVLLMLMAAVGCWPYDCIRC